MITLTTHLKGYKHIKKTKEKKFITTPVHSGFQMTFENGNTISVQFGFGNYCENQYMSKSECKNAEIAIWNAKKEWLLINGNEINGWCNSDEVADYIQLAKTTVF